MEKSIMRGAYGCVVDQVKDAEDPTFSFAEQGRFTLVDQLPGARELEL